LIYYLRIPNNKLGIVEVFKTAIEKTYPTNKMRMKGKNKFYLILKY